MFEEVPSLSPLSFLSFKVPCFYSKNSILAKKYLLPSFSRWSDEEEFARVYLGWDEERLICNMEAKTAFEGSLFHNFRKGDSFEIFIDTRDLKQKSLVTRFCHHFVFFPEKTGGVFARETTKFRTEDMHPLCDPFELFVESDIKPNNYRMQLEIPKTVLIGYDPKGFTRLGFSYRINRDGRSPQHFTVSSYEYSIEESPSLWTSLQLCKDRSFP